MHNQKKYSPLWKCSKPFIPPQTDGMIRFSFNIGCSESKVIFKRWKKSKHVKQKCFTRSKRSHLVHFTQNSSNKQTNTCCRFQGGKTFCASFCASLIAGSRRAFLCVDCVCLLLEFWTKCTRCERLLPVKHFYLTSLLFCRRLKITLDSEQPMLKEKQIIPSVWGGIKGFWTFLKRRVFFWLCIRLIYELISPVWIKTRLYSVVSSYGYFFYMPRFITFAEPALSLSSGKEPYYCLI